jgi:hypothetical protein
MISRRRFIGTEAYQKVGPIKCYMFRGASAPRRLGAGSVRETLPRHAPVGLLVAGLDGKGEFPPVADKSLQACSILNRPQRFTSI